MVKNFTVENFFASAGSSALSKHSPMPKVLNSAELRSVVRIHHLRCLSDDEAAVNVPFREVSGGLVWIATQTRPEIAIALKAVARFSHDP